MNRHCEERSDAAIQKYRYSSWIATLTLAMTIIILLPSMTASAGSPGTIEGPKGCTWNATVKKASKTSISVHVDEQYGSCVDEECPVDAEGKTYSLPSTKYKPGQKIKIWVDLDKKDKERATLNIPKCWTQTVMLPTAPQDIAPASGSAKTNSTPASFTPEFDPLDMPPVEAFPPAAVTRE